MLHWGRLAVILATTQMLKEELGRQSPLRYYTSVEVLLEKIIRELE